MLKVLASLAAGTLFGIGLTISQMINPAKVLGFLDLAGDWDPTLAFVMGGGLLVTLPGYYFARKRGSALLGGPLSIPTNRTIDAKLILGSLIFGVGWAIAGLCPGPAIAGLSGGATSSFIFVASMLAGMLVFRFTQKRV
jgi:uncharacterized membrane protein YedE/YeeE